MISRGGGRATNEKSVLVLFIIVAITYRFIISDVDRQTAYFISPIYNTIWWGSHPTTIINNELHYIENIHKPYRPVMWVRMSLNVTYWPGRSRTWLCNSLKTVETVDEKLMMYKWWNEGKYLYSRNTIKTRDIIDTNMFEKSGSMELK